MRWLILDQSQSSGKRCLRATDVVLLQVVLEEAGEGEEAGHLLVFAVFRSQAGLKEVRPQDWGPAEDVVVVQGQRPPNGPPDTQR